MFGNLSKTLIKAPHYFNNNSDLENNQFSKISKVALLDTYSNIRRLNSRNDNYRYFKERDFVKKNLKIDLNYNNNLRKEITPKVRTKPCMSFEEFLFGNSNSVTKNNTRNITKKSLYRTNKSHLLTDKTFKSNLTKSFDSKKIPNTTNKEKFKNYLDSRLISKDTIEEFNGEVKSNIDNLIDKINNNSLNLSGLSKKFEKNRIENLKEFINRNTVVEPPIKLKFPEMNVQTQDNLYRDVLDKKLNSLSMVSPKIKEQLKSKNRVFASERDFYRYNNSYAMYQNNPFYESIKLIEETKKNEYI
jgi:hypothetical protein